MNWDIGIDLVILVDVVIPMQLVILRHVEISPLMVFSESYTDTLVWILCSVTRNHILPL